MCVNWTKIGVFLSASGPCNILHIPLDEHFNVIREYSLLFFVLFLVFASLFCQIFYLLCVYLSFSSFSAVSSGNNIFQRLLLLLIYSGDTYKFHSQTYCFLRLHVIWTICHCFNFQIDAFCYGYFCTFFLLFVFMRIHTNFHNVCLVFSLVWCMYGVHTTILKWLILYGTHI